VKPNQYVAPTNAVASAAAVDEVAEVAVVATITTEEVATTTTGAATTTTKTAADEAATKTVEEVEAGTTTAADMAEIKADTAVLHHLKILLPHSPAATSLLRQAQTSSLLHRLDGCLRPV
jgi:hypothetical protein